MLKTFGITASYVGSYVDGTSIFLRNISMAFLIVSLYKFEDFL